MQKYGWIAVGIPELRFTYSLGFTSKFNHPEVLVYGLSPALSGNLLHSMAKTIEDGTIYEAGKSYTNVIRDYPARFIEVDQANYPDWLGMAYSRYGDSMKALQMVWCDTNGKFPWEPGFEARYVGKQKMFDEPQEYPEGD